MAVAMCACAAWKISEEKLDGNQALIPRDEAMWPT